MKTLAIILFVAMYVGLIAFPKRRAIIALAVAAISVAIAKSFNHTLLTQAEAPGAVVLHSFSFV